nr:hypothetical protein [Tanacetum cinerariifolium]
MPLSHVQLLLSENIFQALMVCFDQTQPPQFLVVHPPPQETSIEISHDQENVINSVQTFLRKFNRYSFFETPKVFLLAWDRVSEIKDAFDNKQYKPEDVQELFRKLLDDLQNIHEELAEFINSPSWNRPAVYNDDDDDVDYTIAITPVLSTEEPENSLSMRDEHLDTSSVTESDKVIKSSVENLVPIPSEFKELLIETISTDFEFFDDGYATKAKKWFNDDLEGLYNIYYAKYGNPTTESRSGASSSRDHLDAQERKQHTSTLKNTLDFEDEILDAEVQENEATPLSDEEIALDAASQGTMASDSGGEEQDFDYDLTNYGIDD